MTNLSAMVQTCLSYVMHLGPTHWFIGFVATLVVGIVCMRGFGSRSSY